MNTLQKIRDVLTPGDKKTKPVRAEQIAEAIREAEAELKRAMEELPGLRRQREAALPLADDTVLDQLDASIREQERLLDRLNASLPILREQHDATRTEERKSQLLAQRADLLKKQEAGVKRLAEYERLAEAIAQILRDVEQWDREIDFFNRLPQCRELGIEPVRTPSDITRPHDVPLWSFQLPNGTVRHEERTQGGVSLPNATSNGMPIWGPGPYVGPRPEGTSSWTYHPIESIR